MPNDWGGFSLEFFSMEEFDHPTLMDQTFLRDWDTVRMRCGFPLKVNDDARLEEEHRLLYTKERQKGLPWPQDSAHLYIDNIPVRALDVEPSIPSIGDGCLLTLDQRELKLLYEILRMYEEGRWPYLGLICETGHFHVDDTPRLSHKRPYFGIGISR